MKERNLILLGSPEENKIISKIKDKLPLSFSGDNFELRGKKYDESQLLLTIPNPWNPEHLITVFHLPGDEPTVFGFVRFLPPFLYQSSGSESGPNISALPDVLILNGKNGGNSAAGYFDRNWENLIMKY